MKPIPKQVEPVFLEGLKLISRGKVCELYTGLPGRPDLGLKVISDRASAHDIILPFPVPNKGIYLNLIDWWWRQQMPWVRHDVVAIGPKIDEYLPKEHRGKPNLHRRARIISLLQALMVELVFRWLLTGTGLKKYRQNKGVVCGQKLVDGLVEWSEINPSVATPTTKDPDGHDVHMDLDEAVRRFGTSPFELTHPLFEVGRRIAATHGIMIADTKFEVGRNERGELVLIDEVLTSDSSRFLPEKEVQMARTTPGYKPASFDKQPIRDYLLNVLGVGAETPLTDEVIANVHNHRYPDDIGEETTARYEKLHKMLTGMTAVGHLGTLG
ncbi:MAG: phosphoribosylaminoimidazolesuccinocarboxamide synthase [Candidatus Taylorbacteria bacterium]|nr:phosphoribosylaminoimidazolesuccinocarboxamide synthase [Candidatus Taylorbacteria bacterium]